MLIGTLLIGSGCTPGPAEAPVWCPELEPPQCRVSAQEILAEDGTVTVHHHRYDEAGRRTSVDWVRDDKSVGQTTYTYDDCGNLIREDIDDTGSGNINHRWEWEYIAASDGTLAETIQRVQNGDVTNGFISSAYLQRQSGPERLTVEYLSDQDGDGVYEYRATYEYDERNNMTVQSMDSGADGSIEAWQVQDRTYNADGNVLTHTWARSLDGPIFKLVEHTYDALGRLERSTTDDDVDGFVDSAIEITYAGLLTYSFRDSDGDGVVDSMSTDTHDPEGRLRIREGEDSFWVYDFDERGNDLGWQVYDRGGELVQARTRTWDCGD